MVCVSCGRTGDPNRSFCTSCGSAVFVDTPRQAFRSTVLAPRSSSSQVPDSHGLSSGSRSGMPKASAASFPLVGLVKLLVFGYVVWWIGSALLAVPEVRLMWDQLKRGETVTTEPAVNRFKRELGVEPEPPAYAPRSPLPAMPEAVAPPAEAPAPPAPVPTPREEVARGATTPSSPTPSGVFLPGNGVTTPRAVERHLPAYTRQARLAKIEGTVRLRGVVQPNGRITDIEVVKSLDERFGLDSAAIAALQQWRFEPGVRGGRPVPVLVHVDLTFKLPE